MAIETSSKMGVRPNLAITMGDPAGIGPEIIIRALLEPGMADRCNAVVVGDAGVMQAVVEGLDAPVRVHCIDAVERAEFTPGIIPVLDLANMPLTELEKGTVSAKAGRAAAQCIFRGIDLALAGEVDGIVTAPIHKLAMKEAGYSYPGHTEILAEKTAAPEYAMMFVSGSLNVILVTIHSSMREALDSITQERVLEKIQLADRALGGMGIERPRIAVAGINPHAGEGGRFGREEIEILEPAIRSACDQGIVASGPYPPDTVFYRALRREFDVVVSMYHDQGLIPVKLHGFDQGVNVTLGLPFVRTSPDHGTAFDIAWKWKANPGSMISAIELAARWTAARKGAQP